MMIAKKIISMVVLLSFSVNNLSIASEINQDKLSPPTRFSNMVGKEFKDAVQIQLGVRSALQELSGPLSIDSLRSLGEKGFNEKTVFASKISGSIYFNEAMQCTIQNGSVTAETGHFIVKAVRETSDYRKGNSKRPGDKEDQCFYCLISHSDDGKGYEVSVIPGHILDEAKANGTVKFAHESVQEKDRGIIKKYTEHEVSADSGASIDDWISKKMRSGSYLVSGPSNSVEEDVVYLNRQDYISAFDMENWIDGRIDYALRRAGVTYKATLSIKTDLLSKRLVLIKYKKDEKLPSITIGERNVDVYAHSSHHATYIFLSRDEYDSVAKKPSHFSPEVTSPIFKHMIHEIGARCGLPVSVDELGGVRNALDDAVESGIHNPDLKNLQPVDLLELEFRNDYAAGEVNKKESVTRSAMMWLVMASFFTCIGCQKAPKLPVAVQSVLPAISESVASPTAKMTENEVLINNFKDCSNTMKILSSTKSGLPIDKSTISDGKLEPLQTRTSPTNIAMGLLHKVAGRDLGHISEAEARTAVLNMLVAMDKMEKHKSGLFFSWYNPDEEVPSVDAWYVPSIDNANLTASLKIVAEAYKKDGTADGIKIVRLANGIIDKQDYSAVYDSGRGLMVGGITTKNHPEPWHPAGTLGSESRMGSVVMGAMGKIDKLSSINSEVNIIIHKLTTGEEIPVLATWDGGAFQMFMPNLFVAEDQYPIMRMLQRNYIRVMADLGRDGIVAGHSACETTSGYVGGQGIVALAQNPEALTGPNRNGWQANKTPHAIFLVGGVNTPGSAALMIDSLNNLVKNYPGIYIPGLGYADSVCTGTKTVAPYKLALDEGMSLLSMYKMLDSEHLGVAKYLLNSNIGPNIKEILKELEKQLREALTGENIDVDALLKKAEHVLTPFGYVAPSVPVISNTPAIEPSAVAEPATRPNAESSAGTAVKFDLLGAYMLSPTDNWGEAIVEKSGRSLVVKHNPDANGTGHSWAGAALSRPYTLKPGEGIKVTGKGPLQLKLEGSKTVWLPKQGEYYDLDRSPVIVPQTEGGLHPGYTIERLMIEQVLEGTSNRIDSMEIVGPASQSLLRPAGEDFAFFESEIVKELPYLKDLRDSKDRNDAAIADRIIGLLFEAGNGKIMPPEAKEKLAEYIGFKNKDLDDKVFVAWIGKAREIATSIDNLWLASDKIADELAADMSISKKTEEVSQLMQENGLHVGHNDMAADKLVEMAAAALSAGKRPSEKYPMPQKADIESIAPIIRQAMVHVFVPQGQFPNNTTSKYREIMKEMGAVVTTYLNVEDINITNPDSSIIMTINANDDQEVKLREMHKQMPQLRFMNFAEMEDLGNMDDETRDNYEADILSILLVARIIKNNDFSEKSSVYQLLAHLLEHYMPEGATVEDYINEIVTNAVSIIRTILKALPIKEYQLRMREALQVLWSA